MTGSGSGNRACLRDETETGTVELRRPQIACPGSPNAGRAAAEADVATFSVRTRRPAERGGLAGIGFRRRRTGSRNPARLWELLNFSGQASVRSIQKQTRVGAALLSVIVGYAPYVLYGRQNYCRIQHPYLRRSDTAPSRWTGRPNGDRRRWRREFSHACP